jgi:hypothetical protein
VRVRSPRDRKGTFDPKIVQKRQTRWVGFDDKVIALYARGLTVREIQGHLGEIYGTEVSPDLISKITDAVLQDAKAWQTRPLEAVYPIVYLDALVVKIRDGQAVRHHACYLAIGVNTDGERDVLGLWFQRTEGAKFWLAVLTELKQRGVQDVLVCCVDGLTGFPGAIEAVFPQTWVQTCLVHVVRSSLRFVPYRDKRAVATDLKKIYEVVPFAVELGGGGPWSVGGGERSCRFGRRGRDGRSGRALAGGGDVVLDGDGQGCEVLVADDLAELGFGFEHAGRRPAQAHVAVLPVLDVARGAADDRDHRLDRVRAGERAPELLMDAQTLQRDRLLEALAQRRRRPGMRPGQLAGECLQALDRGGVVGELPGRAQAPLDGGAVAFGEVIEDVAFLVTYAALDGHLAEDLADRGPEGPAAVQDDQDALFAVQAAVDEIGQQRPCDGRVLGRSVPQTQRDLDAVGRDAQRHHAAAALEVEPVEHQRSEANVRQAARHERAQVLAGAPDELAADR